MPHVWLLNKPYIISLLTDSPSFKTIITIHPSTSQLHRRLPSPEDYAALHHGTPLPPTITVCCLSSASSLSEGWLDEWGNWGWGADLGFEDGEDEADLGLFGNGSVDLVRTVGEGVELGFGLGVGTDEGLRGGGVYCGVYDTPLTHVIFFRWSKDTMLGSVTVVLTEALTSCLLSYVLLQHFLNFSGSQNIEFEVRIRTVD